MVISEHPHFLVINKSAGLMVHAANVSGARHLNEERAQSPTLVDWLLKHYPEVKTVGDDPTLRPGIVHRLDKETSGVMLVPRDQHYFEYLKSLFQKHEIKKTYLAVVFGKPKKEIGVIDAPIGIKKGTLKRSIHSEKMAKSAVTGYRVTKSFFEKDENGKDWEFSLVEVKPQTGRTHQIRVDLASIGCPIVGDHLYGPKKQPGFAKRLMLHARAIEFNDEDGTRLEFEAELPKEFMGTAY